MRSARSPRSRLAAVTALAALIALGAPVTAVGSPAGDGGHRRICTGSPLPHHGLARDVLRIVERVRVGMDLRSVILCVALGGREVITTALDESMRGVPAAPAMRCRNGNVAISYMRTALLRLVDQGTVRLDDPVARRLPDLEDGVRITLRMPAASITGLVDHVTTPGFGERVSANPFRQWTAKKAAAVSTGEERWYAPSVLHAFTSDRGTCEESTFWNPSWTTDVCDLARSAVGVGSGVLLSPASYQELPNPGTVGLGRPIDKCPAEVCIANTEATHCDLGVLVLGDWVARHPLFFGYSASQAHLPSQRIAVVLAPEHLIPDFG